MSDELNINCNDSNVYRLDIAGNLLMKEPINSYLAFLGDCPRYKKSDFEGSIYYSNSKRQIVFYDKPKEMQKKKVTIPEEFLDYKNRILRYELRFKKRIKDQFKQIVLLSDLYNEDFYIKALWKEED